MSRYLFVVPPFFGHLSPTLSVGAGLIARGHQVAWLGIVPVQQEHLPDGGVFIVPEKELEPCREQVAAILKRQDDGPSLSGPEVMRLALEETYIPIARIMMPGLERVIDEWQPDVIVNDCIAFAGALAAYKKGIPCVTTTPVPPDVMGDTANQAPKVYAWQQQLIRDLQYGVGIEEEGIFVHSHKMNIVFTSAAFAGFTDPEPHMHFVGPVQGRPNHAPFDWERLSRVTTPKVFVSLGTLLVDIRKEFFTRLVEAFRDEPLTIIAATDPAVIDAWPDNFIVQGFVPQSELMPHMDAVICHGGFNTVNDTFMNGLPMLITPIAYDHFHTAALIEKAGCGLKIRYKRMRVPDVREAVWRLLREPQFRQAALQVRDTFIAAGGSAKAISLLENFTAETMSKPAMIHD
ncbi:glycosyltransferase [Taibaiella chishuiensis]|uniref:MGT family glycosyltransferase n=1 Tax=Taibaiella chishuiensis TaxID=1434707 RepID=A0A2P8D2Q3_9BACT|nr:nucleotide disphospho-sugar-binding domain-containing protein [Taibaiella chishuiensis]PSK91469.1 MGT family glycosyltransferase [Taibaiella chishuiensis]